jgi:hypothetical protein
MLKKTFSMCVLFVLATTLPVMAVDLKPGKYEITIKVEMAGMPGGIPTQTTTQCLTKEDPVPNSTDMQGCTMKDVVTKGNTMTYTMACDQQGMKSQTSGKMTYSGNTFEGTNQTKMGAEEGAMTITSIIKGKWIGKCD